MSENNYHLLSMFGKEDDPDKVARGEKAFHSALYHIQHTVDPAYSFILYRFNRMGISHESLDSVLFIDDEDIPCFGVNFSNMEDLTPLARIGTIEHNVGHLLSGHLGDKLGYQLRKYCEQKYGPIAGRAVYYMTIETAADSFVSFPGALQDSSRPFYDIRKLGLERFDPTIEVLRKIEEHVEPSDDDEELLFQLRQLAEELTEDVDDDWGAESSGAGDDENAVAGEGGSGGGGKSTEGSDDSNDATDGGDGKQALNSETGGIPTKDVLATGDKADSLVGEDKIRQIVTEAVRNTKSSKTRGFMKGDCAQFIEAADAQPIVPWYQRMNAAVSSKLSEERRVSKLRLNRRLKYYQGRTYENTTTVTFVVDTSASMGSDALCHVNSEVDSIAQHTDEVKIMHCDSGVAKCEDYKRGMKLDQFFGRGGTSFTPALRYIYENCHREDWPSILVYFTDGYGETLNQDDPVIQAFSDNLVWILTPHGMDEKSFRHRISGEIGEVIKVEEW